MTSAITRAPASAAHAHGFAKSLKGDAPAEGFDALFAAAAGAQPAPVTVPAGGDAGKAGEHGKAGEGARDEENTSPQALLVAAMTFVAPDAKVVDPHMTQAPANSLPAAEKPATHSPGVSAPHEIANADSTPSLAAPPPHASQRIVPNAAFVIPQPVAHALIAHKGRVAESPVPPTADPPRSMRAPIVSETAASPARQEPAPIAASIPSHAEPEPLSTAPPSPSQQTPVERTRNALSPRALVQAAMVEVVRSPGRGRTPPPDAANADPQDTTQPAVPNTQAASAVPDTIPDPAPAPVANTRVPLPPIVEQAVIADATATISQPIAAPSPTAKQTPGSRAAADIARQRQYMLASTDAPSTADAPEATTTAFDAMISMRKADGTFDGRAPSAADTQSPSAAAPSGAWLANLPSSTTQALTSASAVATPRTFDQAAWSAALAQQVTASAVAAARETTVRIKPDGLGPIEVRVRVESAHVDVRFAIEHPVTMNMVREALPDLQRMLAQSGLSLGDAQIAQQNAGNRGQAARGDGSTSQASEDESAAAIGAPVETRPRVRVGLLDDFV